VALYVWDYAGKMGLMRRFWDAAALVSRLIPCCFLVFEAAMAARGMVIKSDVASPTQLGWLAKKVPRRRVAAGTDDALSDRALRLTADKSEWFAPLRGPVAERMSDTDEGRARSVLRRLASAVVSHGGDVRTDLMARRASPAASKDRLCCATL
jgi:hypothetical protein